MKKIASFLLVVLLALSIVSCSNTGNETPAITSRDPLEVLEKAWENYPGDKFAAAGGDFAEENQKMDAPGKYGLDADAMNASFGFPADSIDKIDSAASLMHMMNANTFSCLAVHLKDVADADTVASAIKDNVMNRRWMCGFPDKLVILRVDDCIISMFGHEDLINSFKSAVTAAYDTAVVVCDEPIVF